MRSSATAHRTRSAGLRKIGAGKSASRSSINDGWAAVCAAAATAAEVAVGEVGRSADEAGGASKGCRGGGGRGS